ncbi:hypothetical protein EYF80_022938 [Liparis tanakae]|uniref:Uncharacterized protein n=1 Tax=Liparis tanakae TaxID=230148 RepID=A0A4Z2HLV1_9TELE|nr:hypothetical protein EYF80_022938 [Liparis tanakae]
MCVWACAPGSFGAHRSAASSDRLRRTGPGQRHREKHSSRMEEAKRFRVKRRCPDEADEALPHAADGGERMGYRGGDGGAFTGTDNRLPSGPGSALHFFSDQSQTMAEMDDPSWESQSGASLGIYGRQKKKNTAFQTVTLLGPGYKRIPTHMRTASFITECPEIFLRLT